MQTHSGRAGILNGAVRDAKQAFRGLVRAPGFAAVAALTLALGVGATTAILTVVDVVLLRPLPYPDAGRLHAVWGVAGEADRIQPSYPDFLDWREQTPSLRLGFARGDGFLHRAGDVTEVVPAAMVSDGFLDVLGARPLLGRTFTIDEERPGAPVAVLTYAFWQSRFGGERDVIGRSMVLDGTSYTVVGVMPAGVAYPEWAALWLPLASAGAGDATLQERRNRVDNRAIARVAAGTSAASAGAALAAVAERLAATYPETNRGLGVRLSPMREEVAGDTRTALVVLLGAAALVLVIACANLANLLLARAGGRGREMAVRRALGAGRGRIARQLLTESLVLAFVGGALGVTIASFGLDLLLGTAPAELPALGIDVSYLAAIGVDSRALALAATVTLLTGLLFGAAPAVLTAARAPAELLRGGRGVAGPAARRLQRGLVVAQLALAVALLGAAGLLLRSHAALIDVDPGFDAENLTMLRVVPPDRYASAEARAALYERIVENAEALPGVAAASLINHMPMTGAVIFTRLRLPGVAEPDRPLQAAFRTVGEDFFGVAGVPVLRGRGFEPADRVPGSGAVVINESLARVLWPGEDPLGRSLVFHNPRQGSERFGEATMVRVAGVVGDTRQPRGGEPFPAIYVPDAWDPWNWINLVLRIESETASVIPAVRRAVLDIDPDIPVAEVLPMLQLVRDGLVRERFQARLLLAFALLAMALGGIGVYGVLSQLVAQRTREIGIRMAVGASAADVRRLLFGETARLVAIGTLAGLGGAYALAQLMESLLFGVAAADPASWVAAAAGAAGAAFLATWIPALRAARLDPQTVLRSD